MTEPAHNSGVGHILFATDFSTRSDRAGRRATLLARQYGARMTVVHVVDDDQPRRLVERAGDEAMALLGDFCRGMAETDGVDCTPVVALGEAFEGVVRTGREIDADLIVIGPHRRGVLRGVFVGTTAERTIRESDRPVLVANGPPASNYRNVLVATDMSDCSVAALRTCEAFGLRDNAQLTLVHVFDASATGAMGRASVAREAVRDYVDDERTRAESALRAFLEREGFAPDRILLNPFDGSVAAEIEAAADMCDAELIVVGTRGRTGLEKLLLGSVAEQVLQTTERDVLAVPPAPGSQTAGTAEQG